MSEDIKGTVINIQHWCYQDGPGVRTTVFVKGCSLNCRWCGNPESIRREPVAAFDRRECLGCEKCGRCLKAGLFERDSEGFITVTDRARYGFDRKTVDRCPTGALYTYGEERSAEEIIAEVDKDAAFYRKSGGGLTVSGGEPLLQPEFTAELMKLAHQHGYTTALETAMNVPWENAAAVLPYVDTVLHDIKIFSSEKHRQYTGSGNERILTNLKRAYELFPEKRFITRTPVIAGVNDDEENIDATLEFILPHKNVVQYELLPYHRLGFGKYEAIGLAPPPETFKAPDDAKLKALRERIARGFEDRNNNI